MRARAALPCELGVGLVGGWAGRPPPAAGRAARRTRRGSGAGDGDGSEAGGASESVVGGRRAAAQLRWFVCVSSTGRGRACHALRGVVRKR